MQELLEIYQKHSKPLSCIPSEATPRLGSFPKTRVIIFDLYGTLFISGSGDIGTTCFDHSEKLSQELIKRWVDLPGEVNIKEQLSTLIQEEHERSKSLGVSFPEIDIREIWSRLLSPYGSLSDTQIEVIATSYEVQVNPVWPMPNLSSSFSSLMESNLELGVISNAQFYTHALFPALLPSLSPPFNPDLCLYSYQERQAKPGLFMFKKMVSLLEGKNIKPEETLYLGNDMRNDIDPAHRVGFRTILFAGDARSYRPREDARYSPADAVITDLSQLQELI